MRPAADKFLAGLRHHRLVGFDVVLDAADQIATGGKGVGDERIFRMLDGVAVTEDHHGQFDHFGHRFHRPVAPHRNIDGDPPVVAQDIVRERELVAHARVVLACLDRRTWRPIAIPECVPGGDRDIGRSGRFGAAANTESPS